MSKESDTKKCSYREAALQYLHLESDIEMLKSQILYYKKRLDKTERLKSDLSFNRLGMLGHKEVERIRNEEIF